MKSMDNRRRARGDRDCRAILSRPRSATSAPAAASASPIPRSGLSFGYSMNRMGPGILLNERGQSLVDATYRALGYRNKDAGVWVK